VLGGEPLAFDDATDHADPDARLANARRVNRLHRWAASSARRTTPDC
jgi:hypothetical protein